MNRKKPLKRWISAALAALTLFVCAGSPFAAEKNILVGDGDLDGVITAYDARMALRFAVELENPTGVQILACDVDDNGTVDAGDARVILREAVGLGDLKGKTKTAYGLIADPTTAPATTKPPETTTAPPTTAPPTTAPPPGDIPRGSIDAQARTVGYNKYRFLSTADMRVNATLIYQFLTAKGWSKNAVCGLLGNMEVESTINPAISEIGGGGGYGLVQWTPGSLYKNWAAKNGYANESLEGQLTYLIYTMSYTAPKCLQKEKIWYKPFNSAYAAYGMTASEFIRSNESVGYLALVFMHCYERPGIRGDNRRVAAAERWYSYLP